LNIEHRNEEAHGAGCAGVTVAAGLEGDFGEFLGGIQVIGGGAVVAARAGDARLEEIAVGEATVHGKLALAAGGIGLLVLDEVELGGNE
jgi:hypothetical protein